MVPPKGVHNALSVRSEAIEMLERNGITVYVDQTDKAIRLYNQLRESEAVGGLFHTTC